VIEPIQPSRKIRKVEALQPETGDIVTRLRTTWLGRVYTSHLKQCVNIRWIGDWIRHSGYPYYVNHFAIHLSNEKYAWRPLIKLSEFAKKSGVPTYKLADKTLVETTPPKVFPISNQSNLDALHDRYTFPEIFVVTINNGITYGGTNLILTAGEVVCHDLYDFDRDYTGEEIHGRILIDPMSSRIRWLKHDEAPEPIPVAATFVDACAYNYAHWMTEVLPRIVLFCAEERFKDVPIVVNDGLHKNIMESLFIVAGAEREIILLPIGRALQVDELYLTSVAGYVPFERRNKALSGHSHGKFSSRALEILRYQVNSYENKLQEQEWHEKIFLKRSSGPRALTNTLELENHLSARGFRIIKCEKLTFLQQVRLFSHAKIIIGATGAVFANAIFCERGTQVCILLSRHNEMPYGYWVNMLSPIGINLNYVLGDIVKNEDRGVHGDFEINPISINLLLEAVGN